MSRFFSYMLLTAAVMGGTPINPVAAQCPTVAQLRQELQNIAARPDAPGQYNALVHWKQQWEQCRFPRDSVYINGLLQTGLALSSRNDLPQATRLMEQAVRLCEDKRVPKAPDQPAKACYRLGLVLSMQNRHQEAETWFHKAVQQGQGIGTAAKWVGITYVYLAFEANLAGDFQKAVGYTERAETMARTTGDTVLMVRALLEKSRSLTRLARYEAARRATEQVIAISRKDVAQQLVLAAAYRALGTIADFEGQSARALQYEQQAFEISRINKDPYAPNYAVTLGMHFYRLRQYEQAATYFRYSVSHNPNLYDKAQSLDNLGAVYWKTGQYEQALRCYQQGLMTMPIGFRSASVAQLPSLQTVRQTTRKQYLLTLIQDKADTWLDYARATHSPERLRHALATYKLADQIIDYMRWEHTGQQSKLFWRNKTRGLYERAIETCWRLADTEQAFRFIEKSRAVMLADKLNELGAQQQLTPEQVAREQGLRQSVSELQGQLASSTGKLQDSLRAALFVRQDSLDTFLKQLEVTNPAYYRYKYDNAIPSLTDLRAYLNRRRGAFVSYFVGDSALYILAVSNGRDTLIRQPVGAYAQTVRSFLGLLADPDAMNQRKNLSRFTALGNRLYRQLLAPLQLSVQRVVVSPDGGFVPFDVLSRSPRSRQYLLERHAFSYAYSARLLLRTQPGRSGANYLGSHAFLGVAPVSFAPALGQVSLPGSDQALRSIADYFASPLLLTHGQATRRAFRREAARARVVHLFTHALADDSTGHDPKLYFADSTLHLSEFGDAGLLNTQLVVLAACKTGVGANQRGEGVFSLARGFAALGVPSVLTTLWSVENKATYDITRLFYQHLAEGLPKDIALQRAQQVWLANADGAAELPTYWAGLIIVGDTEPLDMPSRWPWVAGSVLLLGGAAGVWWGRKRRSTGAASSRQPA